MREICKGNIKGRGNFRKESFLFLAFCPAKCSPSPSKTFGEREMLITVFTPARAYRIEDIFHARRISHILQKNVYLMPKVTKKHCDQTEAMLFSLLRSVNFTEQMGYKNFVLGSCPRIIAICTSQILCRCGGISKVGAGNICMAVYVICCPTFRICKCHRGEAGATIECTRTNAGNAIRNGHRGETGTSIKHMVTNACYTRRDGHRGEATTILKRIRANIAHTIRDGHRGEAGAISKCGIGNTYRAFFYDSRCYIAVTTHNPFVYIVNAIFFLN